jgi:tetratricopeptide (TPR) repeat protein
MPMKKLFICFICFSFAILGRCAFSQKQDNAKTLEELKAQVMELKMQIAFLESKMKSEMQHLEEKLQIKNENLLYQKGLVDWWLIVLGIVVALFGIGVPVVGFIYGRKMYHDIENQKKESENMLKEIKGIKEEADKTLIRIKGHEEESSKIIKNLTEIAGKPGLSDDNKNQMQKQLGEMRKRVDISPLDLALNEALEFYLSKEYYRAIEKYNEILGKYKKNITIDLLVSIYFNMANSYYRINQFESALHYVEMVIEFEPNNIYAYNNKGLILSDMGNHVEAIKYYDKAIRLDPKDVIVWTNKGVSLGKLGNYVEEIKCYDEAIKLDLKDAKAWSNKGAALSNHGKYEESIKCYDKAISLDPKLAEAWSNKGISFANLEKYEEAIKCYDEAIKIDPKYANAWSNKGVSLVKIGYYEEAIKCYDESIKVKPDYLRAYANLIELFIILKRMDNAAAYLKKVNELKLEKDFSFRFIEIVYYILRNEWKKNQTETIDELKSAAKNDPANITWSFDDMKNWLASEKSKYVETEKKGFILSLINEIENWKRNVT